MKTQISSLPEKPEQDEIVPVWKAVTSENKNKLVVDIVGLGRLTLIAQWAVSGKNVCYVTFITKAGFKKLTGREPRQDRLPDIRILSPTSIFITDGINAVHRISHLTVKVL